MPLVAVATAAMLGAGLITAGPASADPNPTLTDAYDAVGTSYIGSIGTSIPLGPTVLTETLDLINLNIVGGSLPLPSKQVQFNALGFIPVRATVGFVETTPVTGALTVDSVTGNSSIKANVAYTIKLSNLSVLLFGVWVPLFVGNNCQTINPAQITVSTPAGQVFDLFNGGTVTGKYTIGQFQNCAPLKFPDFFGVGSIPVNALVPGSNNTLSVNLSNGRYAGP
jgi:hypothetical protein